MNYFTIFFLLALFASFLIKLWLSNRHKNYISKNRNLVPTFFKKNISLNEHQKAADYSIDKIRLSRLSVLIDLMILSLLTLGGFINFLYEKSSSFFVVSLYQETFFILVILLLTSLIEIPFNLYKTFSIESKYGFNKMTLKLWLSDLLKNTMIALSFGIPLIICLLWLMESLGDLWWLYAWIVVIFFMLLMQFIGPTFIAPIFNKFTPLKEGNLKKKIEETLMQCGFKSKGLFIMDGSKRSSHGNAYFTGFGKNKRIVMFDTLVNSLKPEEVQAVLAHELGHFKRNHVFKRIILISFLSFFFFYILGLIKDSEWFFVGLNINYLNSNAITLVSFFIVLPIFTFFFEPFLSMYSRQHEFEADEYASKHAASKNLVSALVKLYKDNASTLTPDPIHSAWYDSHPPALIRINRLKKL